MRKENKSKLFKKLTYWIAALALVVQTLISAAPVYAVIPSFDASVDSFTLIDSSSATNDALYVIDGYLNRASLTDGTKLNIRADVSGTSAIGSVKFVLDSTDIRTENTAPYALFGDSTGDYFDGNISDGAHVLEAIPYSGSGATGDEGDRLSIEFTIVDDSTAPTVTMTEPSAGSYLSGSFKVCGTATDDTKVDYLQVRFQDPDEFKYIDQGFTVYPDTSGNWCVDVNGTSPNHVTDGVWGIRIVAWDIFGNRSRNNTYKSFTIDNALPKGSITNPIDGDLIVNVTTGSGEVNIEGNAYDELSSLDYTKGKALIRSLAKKPNGA